MFSTSKGGQLRANKGVNAARIYTDNEKFIGKYVGEVDCADEGEYPTSIDISVKDKSDTKVNVIMDTDGDIIVMSGSVSGNNITIDKVEVEDDTFLSGTGVLSEKTLTVIFSVQESGSVSDGCIFTGVK